MLSAIKHYFGVGDTQHQAYEAYVTIVAQARKPVFYQEWQVDDTLDGRFDCIVLHLCLVLQKMESEIARSDVGYFMRTMTEAFFADMDRSIREMGVGDTGIGLRVKKMAQAFYGRKKAYMDANGEEMALRDALLRNVYRQKDVPAECVASLAAYMARNYRALQGQHVDAMMQGRLVFSS